MLEPLTRTSWALLLFAALASACGEDPAPAPDLVEAAPAVAPDHAAEAVDPPPARIVSFSGTVTVDGAAAQPRQAVEAEQTIEVPAGGEALVTFEEGGHATLEGGSLARVVTEGAAQLFLIRGAAHAVQPPSGSSPRPPLRVVTSTATVEIAAAGEVYIVVFQGGASWVVMLSGAGAVSNGEADSRRRLRTVELTVGHAVAAPNRLAEPTEGPRRLSEARQAARALAVAPVEAEAPHLTHEVQTEADRVDQALRWLETETRRGRELTNAHRAAVREGETDEAARLQRQLVDHSQALYRLRRLATARWERLRAQWLRLEMLGPVSAQDPVAPRRERVTGLLGL